MIKNRNYTAKKKKKKNKEISGSRIDTQTEVFKGLCKPYKPGVCL